MWKLAGTRLTLVALSLLVAAPPAAAGVITIPDHSLDEITDIEGRWSGSWTDDTFASPPDPAATGPFALDVAFSGPAATLTFELGGAPFVDGIPADLVITLNGTLTSDGSLLELSGSDDPYLGDVDGQIDGEGDVSASLTDLPEPGTGESVDRVDIAGNFGYLGLAPYLSLDFTVVHDDRLGLPDSHGALSAHPAALTVPEPGAGALLTSGLGAAFLAWRRHGR